MNERILWALQVFLWITLVVYVVGSIFNGTYYIFDWPQKARELSAVVIGIMTILAFKDMI